MEVLAIMSLVLLVSYICVCVCVLFSTYRYTVLKDNYGDGVSDMIVKPQRDNGVLIKQNMRVRIWSHHCPYFFDYFLIAVSFFLT